MEISLSGAIAYFGFLAVATGVAAGMLLALRVAKII
jgi:hypothetical protein